MSIARALDVADPSRGLLSQVRQRWQSFQQQVCPSLAGCGFEEFPAWLRTSPPPVVDEVLWSFARQGARDGGDEVTAAAALAWALLPGAVTLARRLRSVPNVDERVAAQLWIHVRTFPWRRRRRVAANVLADTRRGVLVDAGVLRQLQRLDKTAGVTTPVDPCRLDVPVEVVDHGHDVLVDRIDAVLEQAVLARVVHREGADLVWRLLDAAGRAPAGHAGGRGGGLLSAAVTDTVGAQLGVSGRTVRRRGGVVLDRLAGYYRDQATA